MSIRDEERGQSIQIGAILIFGILILSLSLYQANVVPAENGRVEFNDYLSATSDMMNLRTNVGYAASRGTSVGTTIKTGVTYPPRILTINPGPPGNRIRTSESAPLTINNASAVESEPGNTRTYWTGGPHSYETTSIRFDTDYNEIRVPPVVYDASVIYRPVNESTNPPYGPNEIVILTDQTLIQGEQISLVTLTGDVDAGGPQTVLTAQAVSPNTRTVVVKNETGNITITVPTDLSAATWEEKLLANQDNVAHVTQNGTAVDVVLEPGTRASQNHCHTSTEVFPGL
ncbi:MAG: hypothetical protein ABEJ74_07950, partial [Haloferacaceae archaeon]